VGQGGWFRIPVPGGVGYPVKHVERPASGGLGSRTRPRTTAWIAASQGDKSAARERPRGPAGQGAPSLGGRNAPGEVSPSARQSRHSLKTRLG
jgi:hypothetical protein